MKYLIWILLLFGAAVALTITTHNPAYVLLVYPPYKIEISLVLFFILLLFMFMLSYGLIRLISAAVQLPAYVRQFRTERVQVKARELLNVAMNAFFEGRYASAEKASAQAMKLGDTSALHPIIAARSAHELRGFKRRDTYLSAAEGKSTGESTMRLMASTKFMLDQHDPLAALNMLRELRKSGIKDHTGALLLELKAQQQAGNWNEVLRVLQKLESRSAIDVPVAAQVRQQVYLENIQQQRDATGLTAYLKNIPADFKRRKKIAATAARALIALHSYSAAQQILSDSLNAQWDSELVALYGDCASGDLVGQIEQAEKWLNQHKNDAGLLLALGKLCLQQKLWGKAQNYLDASVSVSSSNAAYTALGQLAERLGNTTQAFNYYQQAMALK